MAGLAAMVLGIWCAAGSVHGFDVLPYFPPPPWDTKPPLVRVEPNLLDIVSSVSSGLDERANGWKLFASDDTGVEDKYLWDPTETRTDRRYVYFDIPTIGSFEACLPDRSGTPCSGSIKLTDGVTKRSDDNDYVEDSDWTDKDWDFVRLDVTSAIGIDVVRSDYSSVANQTFTFSAYMKTDTWPPPVVQLKAYLAGDKENDKVIELGLQKQRTSTMSSWQEIATAITMPDEDYFKGHNTEGKQINRVVLQIGMQEEVDGTPRTAWIDDIYFGRGLSLEQPQTEKVPFVGTRTSVDQLGNITVFRDDSQSFEPFFPIGIYGHNHEDRDWKGYSEQGFNTYMWATLAMGSEGQGSVKRAADAGMMSGLDINKYVDGDFCDSACRDQRLVELEDRIVAIHGGLDDDLLFYYWDNEHVHGDWAWPEMVSDTVRGADHGQHPIYQLNGQTGVARAYNNGTPALADITGTYIGNSTGDPEVPTNNFVILDNIEGQQMPVVIAQINRAEYSGDIDGDGNPFGALDLMHFADLRASIEMDFRPRVFAAIAHGARGVAYFKDSYGNGIETPADLPVEDTAWWNDLPEIRAEIDDRMDLIQQPHWTEWSATSDVPPEEERLFDFGTRELDGEGYIIMANFDEYDRIVRFNLDGLGYDPMHLAWKMYDCSKDSTGACLKDSSGEYSILTTEIKFPNLSPIPGEFVHLVPANSSRVLRLVSPDPCEVSFKVAGGQWSLASNWGRESDVLSDLPGNLDNVWIGGRFVSYGETIILDVDAQVGKLTIANGARLVTNGRRLEAVHDKEDGTIVVTGRGSRLLVDRVFGSSDQPSLLTEVLVIKNEARVDLRNSMIEVGDGGVSVMDGGQLGVGSGISVINGNLTAESETTLEMQYDAMLMINGDLTLDDTRLEIVFANGFAPKTGNRFELIQLGGALQGNFLPPRIVNLAPGFMYTAQFENGIYRLTALNDAVFVPEPSSLILLIVISVVTTGASTRRTKMR